MTQYYVRPDGNNSNTGLANTAGAAWLTIQKALNTVVAGDIVNVAAGTYSEQLTVVTSGTVSSPIVFNGEIDISGTPLVIIDASTAVSASWVTAPEVGSGVYKLSHASIPGMGLLMEPSPNLRIIHQIAPTYMNGNTENGAYFLTGFQFLDRSPTYIAPQTGINYWDGIEALWGFRTSNSTAYIRYRAGDDPNTKNLRWSAGTGDNSVVWPLPSTACLYFSNKSYNTFNNFTFQGALAGVVFFGSPASESRGNKIIGGIIRCCHFRALFYGNAHANLISTLSLRSRLIGHVIFPYSYPYDRSVRFQQYMMDKFPWGESSSRDAGVGILQSLSGSSPHPTGNIIDACEMFEGANGVMFLGGDGTTVQSCNIHDNSSYGIPISTASTSSNWIIKNNKFIENGSDNIRIDGAHHAMGTCYLANNKFAFRHQEGKHFVAYKVGGESQNYGWTSLWVTHNSFSGSNSCLEWFGINTGTGMPTAKWVNNLFSMQNHTDVSIMAGGGAGGYNFDFEQVQARIGAWGNSAHRGSFSFFQPPSYPGWVDAGTITLSAPVWDTSQLEQNFTLPVGHVCRQAGLDLSQSYTIRGTLYPPHPLYSPGYFTGVAPNIGAWQEPTSVPATISATPTTVLQGESVTVSWTGATTPTDWIGVYIAGTPDDVGIDFKYTSSCGTTAGSTTIPSGSCSNFAMNFPAGVYDFRLFYNDTGFRLAISNQVTVTVPQQGSLPGTSDIIMF